MIIINPGTQGDPSATEACAVLIARDICDQFKLPGDAIVRVPADDDLRDGFYAFTLHHAGRSLDLLIPGDDPTVFFASRPFQSRRMYVDGSSWLWGFAAGFIEDFIKGERE